jgi:hypothetical protein
MPEATDTELDESSRWQPDAKPDCPHCGMPYDKAVTDPKFGVDLYVHESDRAVCRQLPGKMPERIKL